MLKSLNFVLCGPWEVLNEGEIRILARHTVAVGGVEG